MDLALKSLVELKSELNGLVDKENEVREKIRTVEDELSCKSVLIIKDTYYTSSQPLKFHCQLMRGHKNNHMYSWGNYEIEVREGEN